MNEALIALLFNAGVAGAWVFCNLAGLQYTRSVVNDLKEEIKTKDAQLALKDTALQAQRERADALERLIVVTMVKSGVPVPDALLTGATASQALPAAPTGAST